MQPEKILIRGVNWLGDAVMTTPALQRLREAHPKASITMLTQAKLADLWLHHPCLSGVIPIQPGEGLLSLAGRLRKERFDTAVIFPNSPRSALEAFLARIPTRVGYARSWRTWFLTKVVPPNPGYQSMRKRSEAEIRRLIQEPAARKEPEYSVQGHHVHYYLRIVQELGVNSKPVAPQIGVTPEEVQGVAAKWKLNGTNQLWLGLNPGAEYGPAKRWPAERFSKTAIALSQRLGCRWLVFGGRGDVPVASQIAAEIQAGLGDSSSALNLAGQTSLRELCALLRCCSAVITNDSGPMHIAAAVGTPVVGLFGSTSPELTGPGLGYSANNELLKTTAPCAPCFLRECPIDFRCMQEHSVERVVDAVARLLKNTRASDAGR